jgi:hypothetical protein
MRWRSRGTDSGLSAPTNANEGTFLGSVIAAWDLDQVQVSNTGHTEFGCGCGAGASRNARRGNCCEWRSLRIDAQRTFAVGGRGGTVSFNAYNIQFGAGSYGAVNIQCNVRLTVADIRTAFRRSLATQRRIWLGNQAGYDACVAGGRPVEMDPD